MPAVMPTEDVQLLADVQLEMEAPAESQKQAVRLQGMYLQPSPLEPLHPRCEVLGRGIAVACCTSASRTGNALQALIHLQHGPGNVGCLSHQGRGLLVLAVHEGLQSAESTRLLSLRSFHTLGMPFTSGRQRPQFVS